MQCFVYKGNRKDDHFLYLPKQFDADSTSSDLPEALLQMLGELSLVIVFDLEKSKKLANADSEQVIENMNQQGFYLQMPNNDTHSSEERYFN